MTSLAFKQNCDPNHTNIQQPTDLVSVSNSYSEFMVFEYFDDKISNLIYILHIIFILDITDRQLPRLVYQTIQTHTPTVWVCI